MMKSTIKTMMILTVVFLYSCGNTATDNQEQNHEEPTAEQVPAAEVAKSDGQHQAQREQLVMDGDKRWIANAETTAGVNNMITIINNFSGKDDLKACRNLVGTLSGELETIFDKCTMTGAAHDQLHIFLVPIKDVFDKLKNGDLKMYQNIIPDLNKHLASYKNYFE